MTPELQWHAPGPGRWELETNHMDRTLTPFFREVWSETEASGFKWASVRYGAPLSHPEMRFVNGRAYLRIMGIVETKHPERVPPKWLLWALVRLHPEMRRRNRAALRMYRDRLWSEDLEQWERVQKPATIAANLTLQDEPIDEYDDEALADHLERAVENARQGSELHFRLHGADIFIPGDFLAAGLDWGIDPAELVCLLEGSSPASAETTAQVARIAAALQRAGVKPGTLDEVRAAGPDAADALDDYLRYHGWRVVTSYDVDGLTLHELPHLVLGAINAARAADRTPSSDEGRLRDRVPTADRMRFDLLLRDARKTYGLRDDNTGPTYMWPVGLVRRALLEAGRRLSAMGAVADATHLFDATATEVAGLLRGATSPTAGDLAARGERRREIDAVPAPRALGPDEPDPPLALLPPGLYRSGRAALTYAGLMYGPTEGRKALAGCGIGTECYRGRARVAASADDAIARLEQGDVLVTAFTTPAYNAVLPMLGGLVVEEGGAMSHAAIVAREFGLPAIIGALDAVSAIADGDLVEIDPTAGEVRVLERA